MSDEKPLNVKVIHNSDCTLLVFSESVEWVRLSPEAVRSLIEKLSEALPATVPVTSIN